MKNSNCPKSLFLSLFAVLAVYGCNANEVTLNENCLATGKKCINDFLYTCSTIESENVSYWNVTNHCVNGCNAEGTECVMKQCADGVNNNADGSCQCNPTCVNGCLEDGRCRCPNNCTNECDPTGNCINIPNCELDKVKCSGFYKYQCVNDDNNLVWQTTFYCPAGCSDDMIHCKNKACAKDIPNNEDGTCYCDDNCVFGCEENGSCRHPDYCLRTDKYNENGTCACENNCSNDCYLDGSCLADDYEITIEPSVIKLYTDETKEITIQYKKNGETQETNNIIASSLDETCVNVSDSHKVNVFDIKSVSTKPCNTFILFQDTNHKVSDTNVIVTVLDTDFNNNHMHDRYENAPKQGQDCLKHSDCDSETGGDGFCDSMIGFKCSTRCSKEDECVQSEEEYADGKPYHFVCRSDGRCASDTFVAVWEIKEDNEKLEFPHTNDTVVINWGDGSQVRSYTASDTIFHQYDRAGEYTVSIKGNYILSLGIKNTQEPDNVSYTKHILSERLKDIKAFGPVELGVASLAFTNNLIKINSIDIPNLGKSKTLSYAFYQSSYSGEALNKWDTANVTDMSYAFFENTKFSSPIDKWDTSKVTTMKSMFSGAALFNHPLDKWDTSSVTDMSAMFDKASSFNQPLSNWNVENVTSMEYMFSRTGSFNQDLDKWNPVNVTTMEGMFSYTTSFNGKLSAWNTEKLTNTASMFRSTDAFNQPIQFVTKNVTDMNYMFAESTQFNSPFSENWDTSNVQNMNNMFTSAKAFNQDISNWDVSKVETMQDMFRYTQTFNGNLKDWNTESVTNMESMFENAESFNGDLNWNTAKVTNMQYMFMNARSFNGKFGEKWNTAKVETMKGMFSGAISFDQDISSWDFSNVADDNFINMLSKTAMIVEEGNTLIKPASKDDNFCKIYHKIQESHADILISTLTGSGLAEIIVSKCAN